MLLTGYHRTSPSYQLKTNLGFRTETSPQKHRPAGHDNSHANPPPWIHAITGRSPETPEGRNTLRVRQSSELIIYCRMVQLHRYDASIVIHRLEASRSKSSCIQYTFIIRYPEHRWPQPKSTQRWLRIRDACSFSLKIMVSDKKM